MSLLNEIDISKLRVDLGSIEGVSVGELLGEDAFKIYLTNQYNKCKLSLMIDARGDNSYIDSKDTPIVTPPSFLQVVKVLGEEYGLQLAHNTRHIY